MTYAKNLVCGPVPVTAQANPRTVSVRMHRQDSAKTLYMQCSRSATATHGTYNDRLSREEDATGARTSAGAGPRSP